MALWRRDKQSRSLALCCSCAKRFLLSLMVLLRCSVINIHYGFYMNLFSFLLLSPRGAAATFSCLFNDCGWTINNMHASKHSITPTCWWRSNPDNPGEEMLSSKGSRAQCCLEVLFLPGTVWEQKTRQKRIRSLLHLVKMDYFGSTWELCLAGLFSLDSLSGRKNIFVVSCVIIKDGKREDKQQGAQLSVSRSERFLWSCSIFRMQTSHLSFLSGEECFIFRSAEIRLVSCFSKKWISEVFFCPAKYHHFRLQWLLCCCTSLSSNPDWTESPLDLECVRNERTVDKGRGQCHFYWEGRGGGEKGSFDGPLHRWLSSGGAVAIAASFWISTLPDSHLCPCVTFCCQKCIIIMPSICHHVKHFCVLHHRLVLLMYIFVQKNWK